MHLFAHHLEELVELDRVVALVLADLLHHEQELHQLQPLAKRLHDLLQLLEGEDAVLVLQQCHKCHMY